MRRPALHVHWAALPGRARADRWPLAVAGAVVLVTALLALVTPRLLTRSADEAVTATVRSAGELADTTVEAPFPYDEGSSSTPAADTRALAGTVAGALPRQLRRALSPPVATVTTRSLELLVPPDPRRGKTSVQLSWLAERSGPAVEWTAGGPATDADLRVTGGRAVLPVGLSEDVAALLSAHVGDRLPSTSTTGDLDVLVTGVFRVSDPHDTAWRTVPGLVSPSTTGAGTERQTHVGALLTPDALAAASRVVGATGLTRTLLFPARAAGLDAADADTLPGALDGLRAHPERLRAGSDARLRSGLGEVLLTARGQVRAARSQAAVLLAGVLVTAALTLLLAAVLLARRRAAQLATARARGATLAGTAVDLAAESAVLTVLAGGAAVLAAALLVPGRTSIGWLAPVLVVGLLAGPLAGVVIAARATGGRRAPADRRQRRAALRDRQLRRVGAEVALVLLAVGGLAALQRRGVTSGAASPGGDLLVAAGPTLGLLTGGAVVARLLPPLLRWTVSRAARSRRAVPVLAAARGADAARGLLPALVLPVLTLTVATGLVALAATLGATVRAGQVAGSWTATGADVAVRTDPDPALPATAARLRELPGVTQALTARVDDDVQVLAGTQTTRATLVAVDPTAFAALLASTPLPDAPDLARLAGAASPAPRVLVTGDLAVARNAGTAVVLGDAPLDVTPVGRAPSVGAPGTSTVVVDAAAFTAEGLDVPNTLWVLGPGAAGAVRGLAGLDRASVEDRRQWLAGQRDAPLTRGLTRLGVAAGVVLLGLALLAVVLDAAGSGPQRRRTLATLRTLGLTLRQARAVATGELLPPLVGATVVGAALGVLVARLVAPALSLELLTGQAGTPATVVPWPVLAVVVPIAVTGLVVVAAETVVSRRDRLGQVLRVGG